MKKEIIFKKSLFANNANGQATKRQQFAMRHFLFAKERRNKTRHRWVLSTTSSSSSSSNNNTMEMAAGILLTIREIPHQRCRRLYKWKSCKQSALFRRQTELKMPHCGYCCIDLLCCLYVSFCACVVVYHCFPSLFIVVICSAYPRQDFPSRVLQKQHPIFFFLLIFLFYKQQYVFFSF